MASRAPRLFPPAHAVRLGAVVVGVVVGVAVAIGLVAGTAVGVAAALGGLAVLVIALRSGPWWRPLAFGAVVAIAAALASAAADAPVALGLAIAGAIVAMAPFVLSLGPVLGAAPVAIAVAGTDAAAIGPAAAGLGVMAGAAAVAATVRVLRLGGLPPTPLAPRLAWAYVVCLAVGSGAAIAVARALDIAHALWIVVALSAVLVPAGRETMRQAAARVGGTVLGSAVGVAVATVLPLWALVVIAVPAMMIGIGWSLARSQRAAAAYYALAVVVATAGLEPGAAWGTALDRALLTLVGGAIAAALALLLVRVEGASGGASGGATPHAGQTPA